MDARRPVRTNSDATKKTHRYSKALHLHFEAVEKSVTAVMDLTAQTWRIPMPELIAGLIDVFADEPLTGNPLAVVQAADELSEEQMRRLAGEFNQAETTFILESTRADRKLRSFTASGAEIFGAGHNALGAWLWLGEHGDLGPLTTPQTFYQEIGTDVLPIELEKIGARVHGRMRQAPLRLLDPLGNVDPLAKALGLDPCEILSQPTPRPVYTGVAHLLVRVVNPETVDKANPAAKELLGVLKAAGAEGCYIYVFDVNRPQTAYARFFNPTVGLWEDAATGTAAGPLAAYLASEGLVANNELAIEQGTKMGRRSILRIRVNLEPERSGPELSGTGIVVLRGVLRL
jgi:PhzF family phenazine biosynthesis protein